MMKVLTSHGKQMQFEEKIDEEFARALSHVKAYDLPTERVRLGL